MGRHLTWVDAWPLWTQSPTTQFPNQLLPLPALQSPAGASHWLHPVRSQRARTPAMRSTQMGLLGHAGRRGQTGANGITEGTPHCLLLTPLPGKSAFLRFYPSSAFPLLELLSQVPFCISSLRSYMWKIWEAHLNVISSMTPSLQPHPKAISLFSGLPKFLLWRFYNSLWVCLMSLFITTWH